MTFREALNTKDFVVTAHVNLAEAPDAESLIRQGEILRPAVDAVQLTDTTQVHMSGIAAAAMLIQQGIDEGATLVTGGTGRPDHLPTGYYVKPTVLKGHNKMRVFQEEIFGPVVSVTTFKDEDEPLGGEALSPYRDGQVQAKQGLSQPHPDQEAVEAEAKAAQADARVQRRQEAREPPAGRELIVVGTWERRLLR